MISINILAWHSETIPLMLFITSIRPYAIIWFWLYLNTIIVWYITWTSFCRRSIIISIIANRVSIAWNSIVINLCFYCSCCGSWSVWKIWILFNVISFSTTYNNFFSINLCCICSILKCLCGCNILCCVYCYIISWYNATCNKS